MTAITVQSNPSGAGTLTVAAPNTASNFTLTLPAATTTLIGTDTTDVLTNKTINGSQLVASSVAYAKLLTTDWTNSQAASGYQKLPSGLYIQWGNFATGSVAGNNFANGTLTFPNAFPTACFNIIFNPSRGTNAYLFMGSYGVPTATTCAWFINNTSGSSQSPTAHWLAIGN